MKQKYGKPEKTKKNGKKSEKSKNGKSVKLEEYLICIAYRM